MSFKTCAPPIALEFDPPTIEYDINNDYIIISTDFEEFEVSTPGIYVFDSEMNLIKQYPYKASLAPEDNGNALDPNNNILYIFGGSSEEFASLNLLTSEWNIFEKPNVQIGGRPEACFVSSLNELHIISSAGTHTKFNTIQKQFININSNFMDNNIHCNKMMYIPHKKQLIVVPSISKYKLLFYCDIYENQIDYKWYEKNIDMKDISIDEQMGCVLLFDVIILCINFYSGNILFLDLIFDKWYKSKIKYPTESNWTNMVITKDNMLHCTSFTKLYRQIPLNHIFPTELAQQYLVLTNGFIRCINSNMPTELIYLISKYITLLFQSW
eukprot:33760_1